MNIPARAWKADRPPRRVLAIRLQAMGDMIITLPYLQHVRNMLPPGTRIDLLTREEVMDIPKQLELFDHVYAIGGARDFRKQMVHAVLLLPSLMMQRYDVVLDLQNNPLSRMVRNILMPRAWTAFDRFSPRAAGERTRLTLEAAGLGAVQADGHFKLKPMPGVDALLLKAGWQPGRQLVILNPAGAFENRNWPVEHYVTFARLWLEQYPESRFLVMGIEKIAAKASALKAALGNDLINLVNQTDPVAAFAIIQKAAFVLSEDSGLMHMAWVSGIPTLVLFGSTRSDWSRPLGAHTAFLDSADMACGSCMLERCRFDDERENQCMLRYTPGLIFRRAQQLLERMS